jgi:flagellin-specific chaperone FliS
MNEKEYLELVNQLRDKFNEVEEFHNKIKKKNIEMLKLLSIVYTFSKELNDNIGEELPSCYKYMLERIVALCCKKLFYDKEPDLDLEEVDFSLIN